MILPPQQGFSEQDFGKVIRYFDHVNIESKDAEDFLGVKGRLIAFLSFTFQQERLKDQQEAIKQAKAEEMIQKLGEKKNQKESTKTDNTK